MIDEKLLGKLLIFLLNLTQSQFEWLQQLQRQDWAVDEPKLIARHLFDESARAGIRRSVAHPLAKVAMRFKEVEISAQDLSRAMFRAYEAWDKVGTQELPEPPPLVLDPILKELNQKPETEE